jgi:tetratricopeptide (TPR) repeat protein
MIKGLSLQSAAAGLISLAVSSLWLFVAVEASGEEQETLRSCVLSAAQGGDLPASNLCRTTLVRQIAQEPYDGSALAGLALMESAVGNGTDAEKLIRQAVAVDGASRLGLSRLLRSSLAEGEYSLAVDCLDRLLRTAPDLSAELAFAVAQQLDQPGLRMALVRRLEAEPPWSGSFIATLSSSARAKDLSNLLALSVDTSTRSDGAVWKPVFQRLLRAGHDADLRSYTARRNRAAGQSETELLRDSDFALDPAKTSFGWDLGRGPGASVSYVADIGGRAGGLQLQSDLFTSQRPLVSQVLLARSGKLQVEMIARTSAGAGSGDFLLSLRCDRGAALGKKPITAAQSKWSSSRVSFEIPEGCPVQLLSVVAKSSDIRSSAALEIDRISARNIRSGSGL